MAGQPAALAGGNGVIPLAVYPAPSATRTAMLDTLRDAGRVWSIATESSGLSGIVAALEAGLAISAFSDRFAPPGIERCGPEAKLPALPVLDYVLDQRPQPRDPAIDAFVAILVATIASEPDAGASSGEAPREARNLTPRAPS